MKIILACSHPVAAPLRKHTKFLISLVQKLDTFYYHLVQFMDLQMQIDVFTALTHISPSFIDSFLHW